MRSTDVGSERVSIAAREPGETPIAALIFDMDGLLVDSEPASELALRRFLLAHGRELLPDTLSNGLGRRLPEAIALIRESYALTPPLDELIAAFDALRLDSLRGAIRPMPGADALLVWAVGRHIPIALATSSFRHQADVALEESGLAGRFGVEVTGDEVDRGKPEPDLFLLAARRLGTPPEACLVFEDAPAGLKAAARAGMRRIWIPNAHTRELTPSVAVDAVLDDLTQAISWLESPGVLRAPESPIPGSPGTISHDSTDPARQTSA